MDGASLTLESIAVQPGVSQIAIEIKPAQPFAPGAYAGQLVFDPIGKGLQISPETPLPISFTVDPFWVSCKRPLIISGLGLLIGSILLSVGVKKARRTAQPPIVKGTLIHWNEKTPDLTATIDLTGFKKTEVCIGKDSRNEIVIPDEDLEDVHALITAERDENEVRFILQPRAKVKRGYRDYSTPIPLEENTTYQMGSRMFKFIRDAEL